MDFASAKDARKPFALRKDNLELPVYSNVDQRLTQIIAINSSITEETPAPKGTGAEYSRKNFAYRLHRSLQALLVVWFAYIFSLHVV